MSEIEGLTPLVPQAISFMGVIDNRRRHNVLDAAESEKTTESGRKDDVASCCPIFGFRESVPMLTSSSHGKCKLQRQDRVNLLWLDTLDAHDGESETASFVQEAHVGLCELRREAEGKEKCSKSYGYLIVRAHNCQINFALVKNAMRKCTMLVF